MPFRRQKIVFLIIAAAMLPSLFVLQKRVYNQRAESGMIRVESLKNAPPALAFTTVALGGFRGLISNLLWVRAIKLQEQGNYFEMVSLADWIAKLQPDNGMVWAVQAWNMTYNISTQFSDHQDRWLWVKSGMDLLRDQGIRYNPNDVDLYRELAWFYQDKMGSYTDEATLYFKAAWAREMRDALGPEPDIQALANPVSEEDKERAEVLRTKHKLDPERMLAVDQQYGPFDWRVPESHAIYWSVLGFEKCKTEEEIIKLRRVLWQSMQRAVQKGNLIENFADQRLEFGPNLDMIPNANRAYENMLEEEPDRQDYIGLGHSNFLRDAVYFLYTHSRIEDALRWYRYGKEQYPQAFRGAENLDDFVVQRVDEQVTDGKLWRVNAILEGILGRYYYSAALGDEEQANGYAMLARNVWVHYQNRFGDKGERLSLASLDQLKKRVLDQIREGRHGFSPALRAALGIDDANDPDSTSEEPQNP